MRFLRSFSAFILLASLVCFASCAQKKESLLTKKYAPMQLQEDATLLCDVLLQMHPAIGIYQPRPYYEALFQRFKSELRDSLTEKQFRLKTKLLIDHLHCGHSEVLHSSAFYKEIKKLRVNYSPYVFLPVQGRVYMIANLNKKQDSAIAKGAEITGINGIPVDSMLRYTSHFISTDGFNKTAKEHYVQMGFNSYYPALFGRPDTFEVEYKKGKESKTVRYKAFQPKAFPPVPLEPKKDSLLIRFKQAKIAYRFMDADKKAMYLKISKFSHRGDIRAYRRIFKKLRRNKSEHLILDLRNNGGGSLANSYRLLSYLLDKESTQTLKTGIKNYPHRKHTRGNLGFKLTRLVYRIIGEHQVKHDTDYFVYSIKPRKRNHYDKKIYVLINGGSFSASCLVASYLKTLNRSTFIGEETGGNREGCNAGVTPYYKLPHTKLRVRVPAFRIMHDVYPVNTGYGILPDYSIRYNLRDIFSRNDLELEKALSLINPVQ